MDSANLVKSVLIVAFSLTMVACPPYGDKKVDSNAQVTQNVANTNEINQQLSKSYSGRQTLNDMNQLVSQGYTIQIYLISQSEIQSMNGHSGGGIKRSGNVISIYINNSLGVEEQAHVVAHEMVHVKDDFDVDSIESQYPDIRSAAQDFISRYATSGVSSFDQRIVEYVLGTLFCSEIRAYTKNQQLYNEGLPTSNFAKGSGLAQFVDQNYIYKFGTRYGSSANNMASWCQSKSSMMDIQYQLIW